MREVPELAQQPVELGLLADRVAADQRRTGDDAIREERVAARREVVALVLAKREEGEAVGAVRVDELAHGVPFGHGLLDRMLQRSQPEEERREAQHEPGRLEHVAEPVRDLRSAEHEAERRRANSCGDEHDHEQRPRRVGVAGRRETAAVAQERSKQHERRRRLLEVEAFRHMRDRRADHDHDRKQPRAPAPARERAREPDQRDPERERDDPSRVRHPGGRTPCTIR